MSLSINLQITFPINWSFKYKMSKNFPEPSDDYKTLQVNEGLISQILVFKNTVHTARLLLNRFLHSILLPIVFHIYKNKCTVHLRSSPLSLAPSHLCFLSLLSSFPFLLLLLLHHCPFPWEHLKMSHKNSPSPQIRSVTEITRRDYRGHCGRHRRHTENILTMKQKMSFRQRTVWVSMWVSVSVSALQQTHKLFYNQEGDDPTEDPHSHWHHVTVGGSCAGGRSRVDTWAEFDR